MIRFLVVDDVEMTRKQIKDMLEHEYDCAVEEASDGEIAVDKAGRFHPDIVLMDVEMGGMSGIDATRVITKHAPGTKVIIITGLIKPSCVVESIRAGASNFMLKPVDSHHLFQVIHKAMEANPVH